MTTSSEQLALRISSLADLGKLATAFATHLPPDAVVGLSGPLGAGKTEFVRALLTAWGSKEQVVSPTFVLETIYSVPAWSVTLDPGTLDPGTLDPGTLESGSLETDLARSGPNTAEVSVHHWDLYRLTTDEIPEDLLECCESPECMVLIEWPEQVAGVDVLLDFRIMLDFEPLSESIQDSECLSEVRNICVSGPPASAVLKAVATLFTT